MQKNTIDIINEKEELEYENIKDTIKTGNILNLNDIQKQYYHNSKIQSAIIKRYIMEEMYDKAIEICKKHEDCVVIQSQLVTIYIKQNKIAEAIEICHKFIKNAHIQNQFMYICTRLKKIGELNISNDIFSIDDMNNSQTLDDSNIKETLMQIKTKLATATMTKEDLIYIESLQNFIEPNIYKFILVAAYHRLGLIKSALITLKTIDPEYKKYKTLIYEALISKKGNFYNLGLYDEIINWDTLVSNKKVKQI